MNWVPEDLDRCEHGRHSNDPCFDCPGRWSSGNLFLDPLAKPRQMQSRMENNERRIGTDIYGEAIYVVYRRDDR